MPAPVLQSLIADRWVGTTPASLLRSAIDGSAVAHTHAEAVDFAEAVHHARTVGLPALLKLDFQQRAARLKALATYLLERKEALYTRSRHSGATRADSWIDIEGGTGTLFAYAGVGAGDLPSGNVVHEGPAMPLGKTGAFAGTHILVPRRGAHQRLQLPRLGLVGEVCARLPGGHAVHRQAGHGHQLAHRGGGADDE